MILVGHYVYTARDNNTRLYFNGTITEDGNVTDIDWTWTEHKEDAILLPTPDAWEIMHFARQEFNVPVEVERVMH